MDPLRIRNACSETLVLSLLEKGPMHGYEMCKEIDRRSRGFFVFKHSTIYPILHHMAEEGLVTSQWLEVETGKPQKQYRLTQKGPDYHKQNLMHWRELLAALQSLVPEMSP